MDGVTQGGRAVYQQTSVGRRLSHDGASNYLYYWSEYTSWRIGSDYNQGTAGVYGWRTTCPEASAVWGWWDGSSSSWVADGNVAVACPSPPPSPSALVTGACTVFVVTGSTYYSDAGATYSSVDLSSKPGKYFNIHHTCFGDVAVPASAQHQVHQVRDGSLIWSGEVQLWWTNENSAYNDVAALGRRHPNSCLLYTSPSPRDGLLSRMPSSA